MTLRSSYAADAGRTSRFTAWQHALPVLALAVAVFSACVYDPDDVCSDNQVVAGAHDELCVCAPGFVMVGTSCVACGEHEVAAGSSCACEEGYERASPDALCMPSVSALGNACDTESQPCTSADYPRCEPLHGTSGYCTKEGCSGAGDCEKGYSCNTAQDPAFCEKPPPTGEGAACAATTDCSGQEASFCDTFVTHTCLVQNCTTDPDTCSKGRACCAIPGFLNLCLPEGACQI